MEDKLTQLVTRVERSNLTDAEKEELYGAISEGLHATVLPVLVKFMPPDQVTEVTDHPETLTVDRYVALVSDAVVNKEAMPKIAKAMDGLLSHIDGLLSKEGI